MKQRLLDFIVCPSCRGSLILQAGKRDEDEIMDGELTCTGCSRKYPILRGVPRLLPESFSKEQRDTADAFGYEWTHFTELEDTYEAEFLDWIAPIGKDFFKGKLVLDGGCGKGRHTALSAAFGAKEVIGVDISEAVEAAFPNTRRFPNAHIIQGDIYNLPVKPVFQYAYSIGVLHHLPDPKKGFLSVVGRLAPGGRMSAWVYGEEGNWWITHLVTPFRESVTSRVPKPVTQTLSFLIALPMQATLRLVYKPVNEHLPVLKKFLFYNDYLYSISGFSFRENFWNVFDHLVAPTAFYISRPEFDVWFKEAALGNVDISWRNRNSWRGTGVVEALKATQAPSSSGNTA